MLLPLDKLAGWYDRVNALGHGSPVEMSSADALAVARDAVPAEPETAGTTGDLRAGETVTVTPDDTGRDPVRGELVAAETQTVVIRHDDPSLGRLHLHFPRAGFEVSAA